jgi:hypothetical protein
MQNTFRASLMPGPPYSDNNGGFAMLSPRTITH